MVALLDLPMAALLLSLLYPVAGKVKRCAGKCYASCTKWDICNQMVNQALYEGYRQCKLGWKPPYCTEHCDHQTWGHDCKYNCSHCFDTCDVFLGECNLCKPGYRPDMRRCDTMCADGDFGAGCATRCGMCTNNTLCDKVTGFCPDTCQPGFKLPTCIDRCDPASFGESCMKTCGKCKEGTACNHIDGRCQACAPGYLLPFCTEACEDGEYGENCGQACGQCEGSVPCDKDTGHCPGDCKGTVLPPLCQAGCKDGFYGSDCDRACGECKYLPCHKTTGVCPCRPTGKKANDTGYEDCDQCQEGSDPPLCILETAQSSLSTSKDLGLGLGLGMSALVILAFTVFVVVRKKRRQVQKAHHPREDATTAASSQGDGQSTVSIEESDAASSVASSSTRSSGATNTDQSDLDSTV
ncbi:scavenger receptor class F member 1-like [Littorina saxatilis]|uniref:scavenger receptor class F member 1-like n=1 Tax=Littorina saxatilis TaxID=31220 RepID=UPI0038B49FA5